MLRIGYFCIIFSLCVSCTEDPVPEHWSEPEAVQILADLHIVQAALKQVKRDSLKLKEAEHMNYLLNLYDLNAEELNEIVNYAQSDVDRSTRIYPKIIARLDSLSKVHADLKKQKK